MTDRVKLSFVIFDIRALSRSALRVRQLNPVWHMMLYSCNHVATVGVKGLTTFSQ